jgi:hypothetical protein
VAPGGDVYIAGDYYYSTYRYDGFLTKVDANGNFIWDRMFRANTSTYYDYIRSVEVDDATGEVYVSGYSQAGTGGYDWWAAKLNSSGSLLWNRRYYGSSSEYQYAKGLELSNAGNLVLMGLTYSYGAGGTDFAAFNIDPATGIPTGGVTTNGNSSYQYPYGGSIDATGNAVIAGYSYISADWVKNSYSLPSYDLNGDMTVYTGSLTVYTQTVSGSSPTYWQLISDPSYVLDTGAGGYDTAITKFTP